MSRYAITLNLQAGGNISPRSFVKGDPSNGFQCLQAGVGDTPIGISGTYTRIAPGTPGDDSLEAIAGEFPEVFAVGSVAPLQCGTAWTAFQYLKPDANGFGAPITSSTDISGAFSLEASNAGEFGRVYVLPPEPGIGAAGLITTAVSATLLPSDSGKTIVVTAADKTITTPAGVAGMRYRVLAIGTGATGGAVGTILHVPTGDTLAGNGFTAASGKGAVDTHATAVDGDFIEILCISANTWYVVSIKGTWAREA